MFIYLDESYNLKDRSKKQFISINGFMAPNISIIRKKWLKARKQYTKRKRIHARDSRFEPLRKKVITIIQNNNIYLLSAFQDIQKIPFHYKKQYFIKNQLNFEKVYTDICKHLLAIPEISQFSKITTVIDNRKNKNSLIGKNDFIIAIEKELKKAYPKINIERPRLLPSTSDVLLELTDFISNIFYKAYINNNENEINKLNIKVIQTKNPLN